MKASAAIVTVPAIVAHWMAIMDRELLSSAEAARRLAIARATFYEWLGKSNAGEFLVRGEPYTIEYFQGGPNGQGRIRIDAAEIERLKEAMRVRPQPTFERRPRIQQHLYPGIDVPLGNAD